MSSFWDDSDSDSSSGDDGPTLRQRRDKWRRLVDNIRAEADPWQSGCGVPAGPRMRKKRAHELPGTRDKRFSHMTSARGMSVLPGVLTTLRARGGASSGTRMCMTRQVLQGSDSGASFACPRWVWMPWFLKSASNLSGVTSRFVWLQTKCTAFRSESALRLGQTFCKQNVWHFVECKVAFFDKKPNEMHEAFRVCALHRM
jgi:hypothetical protein